MTKNELYEELRRRIVTLELAPAADLDEAELSAAYGMSRTPVREILIRLQTDGLVVARHNRGVSVTQLDVGRLQSWFEAGPMVHKAVVRLAAYRRRKGDLEVIRGAMEELEEAMAAEDGPGMVLANERFHDLIGQAARNAYLYASYSRVLADHARIAELCYGYEGGARAEDDKQLTRRQHLALYEAIASGDAATAEQVIEEHLTRSADGLRHILKRSGQVLADVTLSA
jgi:DNA-binding GntR family transcriptional regulator